MGPAQVSTLPSRGPKRRLVPSARFDELVSRAATVGVSVRHRAAQFLDGWCFPRGLREKDAQANDLPRDWGRGMLA
jgi:hypothetical protein